MRSDGEHIADHHVQKVGYSCCAGIVSAIGGFPPQKKKYTPCPPGVHQKTMIKREGSLEHSSTNGDPSQRANKAKRKRAAFACKPCNSRRLKCDAVESGLPCTRCRSLGREADCEPHQSRRGK